LALAGLFQRDEQNNINKFPFLGDLPVLGALFRSTAYQRDETELVILVTPYLTQPVSSPAAFPLPSDRAPSTSLVAPTVAAGFVGN
jgi:pilus assembly protein CpaC